MSAISILNKEIRNLDGLFCLNDLHKAAGNHENHRPSKFVRTAQTKALISEINLSPNMGLPLKTVRSKGTFVCKELVIAYGSWINPTIHLAVIRAFLDAQQPSLEPPKLTDAQKGHIYTHIQGICAGTRNHNAVWGALKANFGVNTYHSILEADITPRCVRIFKLRRYRMSLQGVHLSE